ncbi:hypothetical protein SAMN05443254_109268 [Bradyrhizobium sp. OK095]|nr:hypothetical protein SAMN05443254_109268 [Bradyrhizobium sp. OK095]
MKELLTWTSVVLAGIAAVLWFASASNWMNNYVDEQTETRADRMVFLKNGRKVDLVGTTANQSRWSGYAAIVTGIAVLLQALGMAPPCPPA